MHGAETLLHRWTGDHAARAVRPRRGEKTLVRSFQENEKRVDSLVIYTANGTMKVHCVAYNLIQKICYLPKKSNTATNVCFS